MRQAKRVAAFDLAMLIWAVVFAAVYWALGAPICANIVLFSGVVLLVILLAIRRGESPALCGQLFCATGWIVYTALAYFNGGAGSSPTMWYASIPVLSLFLCGTRPAIFWTIASVLAIGAFSLLPEFGIHCPIELTPVGHRLIQFAGVAGLVSCVYLLVWVLINMEYNARQALHDANSRLELQASTDGLTGIANRRCFDRILEKEWARHQRTRSWLSLLVIDADFFKNYNDAYGHLAGDDCLRSIASVIQSCLHRPSDLVARIGGEEFAVILPDTKEQGACLIADEIRLRLRALKILHPRSGVSEYMTISVGVATAAPTVAESYLEFLDAADGALYRAKAKGRDRIVQVMPLAPVRG
jgi:diguanylate cyclase (GGDEF)-like protein